MKLLRDISIAIFTSITSFLTPDPEPWYRTWTWKRCSTCNRTLDGQRFPDSQQILGTPDDPLCETNGNCKVGLLSPASYNHTNLVTQVDLHEKDCCMRDRPWYDSHICDSLPF